MAGAGPSGLAVALMLARQGRRVVVHERFESARPVGAGFMLQPTGRHVLGRLGLTELIDALGQPVHRLFGREARHRRIVLDVRYGDLKRPRAPLGVHRATLFDLLHGACVEAGVDFQTGFEVTEAGDGRLVAIDGRATARFDMVIDAMGVRSPVARAMGARPRLLPFGALWVTTPWPGGAFEAGTLEQVYSAASRMVGVMPTGRRAANAAPLATFFWSLRGRDHAAWIDRGLDRWKAEVLAMWPGIEPVLEAIAAPEALTYARYSHHTLAWPAAARLAVIGDAAHSTSPQLGQGVNMGLLDALALAEAIDRHGDLEAALGDYARARWAHVRLYQTVSAVFTPLYQADDAFRPWLRDHVLCHLTHLPLAPRFIAATASGLLLDPR